MNNLIVLDSTFIHSYIEELKAAILEAQKEKDEIGEVALFDMLVAYDEILRKSKPLEPILQKCIIEKQYPLTFDEL